LALRPAKPAPNLEKRSVAQNERLAGFPQLNKRYLLWDIERIKHFRRIATRYDKLAETPPFRILRRISESDRG
jgi:hypothetical protein